MRGRGSTVGAHRGYGVVGGGSPAAAVVGATFAEAPPIALLLIRWVAFAQIHRGRGRSAPPSDI